MEVRCEAKGACDLRPKLEPFLQSASMKAFRWAWFAVVVSLLLVAVSNLLTPL